MATGPVPTTVQFTISPPPGTAFGAPGVGVNIETTAIALSPDGSQLAFVAMTSNTNYANARVATMNAAGDLYGAGSAQQNAVAATWDAVNVH